jgi:hypothetical protein
MAYMVEGEIAERPGVDRLAGKSSVEMTGVCPTCPRAVPSTYGPKQLCIVCLSRWPAAPAAGKGRV